MHLPGTLRNDQFGQMTVAEALDVLADRSPAIEAIGVTDYFTTASYHRATAAFANGAGAGIALIFPNVEVRFASASNKGTAINAHLLCAPEDVGELERFLLHLTFSYRDTTLRCCDDDLRRLGRLERDDRTLSDEAALRAGANLFKVDSSQLRDAFERDEWAREHILLAVPGSSGDGTAGLQSGDDSYKALRESIERMAHIIFSSNPKQTEFWLGRGALSEEELTRRYKGKKLCLHGSDAHEAERLGEPEQQRLCWLKGSASFETLRMAVLAPGTRGHIGPTHPLTGYELGRISRVSVTGREGWFPQGGIALNPGLIAVIGQRGSGKTALADLIAVGAGSDEPFHNRASFVSRAGRLLHGCTTEVEWSDGEVTSGDCCTFG